MCCYVLCSYKIILVYNFIYFFKLRSCVVTSASLNFQVHIMIVNLKYSIRFRSVQAQTQFTRIKRERVVNELRLPNTRHKKIYVYNYLPIRYKSTLVFTNTLPMQRFQSIGQKLRNNFVCHITKTDRSIVRNTRSTRFLWDG